MLRSAEFSASINSNAGNPFNRFGQHEIFSPAVNTAGFFRLGD